MAAHTQNIPLGIFEGQTDIGNVKIKGSSVYNEETHGVPYERIGI
jgi:hypothetical protein